jgi:Amidohydrolase family
MNRQSLGPLIVGIISVGSGLWVALQLRIDRCLDAGGRWDAVRRVCQRPEGAPPEGAGALLVDYAIGGAVMLLFGYLLMRMWAAIVRKNQLRRHVGLLLSLVAALPAVAGAQVERASAARAPTHGVRAQRLAIRNATIVDGNGTPASGPADILVEGDRIARVVFLDPVALRSGTARRPAADVEIDATGKFVLPGLINAHAHLQDERARVPQPYDYTLKLWLACGITTVREVGADTTEKVIAMRDRIARGQAVGPKILVYGRWHAPPVPQTPELARVRVRDLKRMGADGIKIVGIDRDLMAAMLDEAHKVGLRVAHHAGVEETNAWDDARFGTTSIEHWYGIPDAAILDGRQHFPSDYNYRDETDRFRWAGRLWREADSALLARVLDTLVAAKVAWVPTLDIYEASRDLQRAQTQPWFADYLHPTLEEYFRPDPANHGSYFFGWSSTDETYWKENYRLWMRALVDFERRGGVIGAGDDAGFIYQMYGFGLVRELELHQEAGFQPLEVIQHATGNNARILGREGEIGRVRAGFVADLIVVNGNPLENLKVLYPTGVDEVKDGVATRGGGIEWTVRDGIPYHVPTLMAEVKRMVAEARAGRGQRATR